MGAKYKKKSTRSQEKQQLTPSIFNFKILIFESFLKTEIVFQTDGPWKTDIKFRSNIKIAVKVVKSIITEITIDWHIQVSI